MENVNFKEGIKKILTANNFALTKDGMDLLNRILQFLNSKLVNFCLDNSDGMMNATIARDAVDAVFTGNLKHCALAEGNRFILLYSNGMMEYKPVRIVKRKKGKKALAIAALEFSRGISDLTSLLFPEASLQEEAKKILCQMLEEMAVKISDLVQSNGKNSITQDDIRAAAERILPRQLFTHALAEGARMTALYETGMLQEPTRKRSVAEMRTKRAYKKAAPVSEKKPSSVRKRKRSPSEVSSKTTKRRRILSAAKAPKKKAVRKMTKKKAISKSRKAPRKVSRERITRSVSRRVPSSKRRVSSKVSQRAAGRKISRKRRASKKVSEKKTTRKVPRRAPSRTRRTSGKVSGEKTTRKVSRRAPSRKIRASRKVSEKKTTRKVSRRAPSRKREVSKKTKSVTRERPLRVSPKRIRKISRKDTTKVKVVSEISLSTTVRQISQGVKKLSENYPQKISAPAMREISECLGNLLDDLIAEMRKSKYSVIGPREVREVIMKLFPKHLAGLAIANMSRVLMNN